MVKVLSMVDGKIMQWMLSAHMKVHNWRKVGCKNTVLGIMLYLMYKMERFLMQQFGPPI